MIYLIGGAPRCGKTTLTKLLAHQKKISYLSTDTIRHMIVACTPYQQRFKKFPIERQKSKAPYYNLRTQNPNVLLKTDLVEARSIWPSTKRLIEDLVESQEDFVIEGTHLMPMLVKQLQTTPTWKQIRLVYLIKADINDISSGFYKNQSPHDWLAGALNDKDLISKVASMVHTESVYIAQQAKKLGFSVVDTGKDFEKELESALNRF